MKNALGLAAIVVLMLASIWLSASVWAECRAEGRSLAYCFVLVVGK